MNAHNINFNNNKQAGFSLVQVMVGVGVMGIIMAGMTAMQANQSKEMRALNETLARAELDRNIIAALSDGKVCTFLFNSGAASAGLSPSNAQFTAPATPPASPAPLVADAFTLNKIPVIDSTSAPPVVAVDTKASVSSNTPYIDSAANKGIKVNITSDAGSGRFTANLVISFDNTTAGRKSVRQLMPLTFPISLQTTSTSPGSYTVKSCQLANGQGTANYIAKWQSMTSLDNSVIYQDPTNGNVGIGTTSPGTKLQVKAASLSDGISLLSKTNNNIVGLLQDNGDDGIFRLYTSGSERVVIRGGGNSYITGGNVGIGTTSPMAKLDVAGTFKLVDGTQGKNKVLTSDANGNATWSSNNKPTSKQLGPFGGSGGFTSFVARCPLGTALTGFSQIRSAVYVDGFSIICGDRTNNSLYISNYYGGVGGTLLSDQRCPTGSLVWSIGVASGSYVSALILYCDKGSSLGKFGSGTITVLVRLNPVALARLLQRFQAIVVHG